MRRRGDMLVPADEASAVALRALPTDQMIGVDTVVVRNFENHKRAMALVRLSFDYWEPKNFVSTIERKTVGNLGKFMVSNGVDRDAARALCKTYLQHVNANRQNMAAERSFESFREFITIEAGYCDTVLTPAGPKRMARSWAYKNMTEQKFQEMYKAIFAACWDLVLKQTFDSESHVEQVVMELIGFDR